MNPETLLDALALGILEGVTEFIPVSSTGHILLLGHFLGFESTGKTFEVLIQLGAILAIVTVYFRRFIAIARALPSNPGARRFVLGVVVAFLPAAVAGVLLHKVIKTILFESPALICTTLLLGGIVLLVVDRLKLRPRYVSAYELPLHVTLGIGLCQIAALVPGMSRSGSTIVGALFLGVEKRAAAEFSFFLALPTMLGAFTYDLYKNRDVLSADDALVIAIGFAAAFISAVFVIRRLLAFVQKRGYALFGWWRILVALLGFAGLALSGELGVAGFGPATPPAAVQGNRLVTTTTVHSDEPVGELPLGGEGDPAAATPAEPAPAGAADKSDIDPNAFDTRFSVEPPTPNAP